MIKMIGKIPRADYSVEIDDYIPINIEVGNANPSLEKLYWRLLDDDFSMLEIGVSSQGEFLSATLTAISSSKVSMTDKKVTETLGDEFPHFDVTSWFRDPNKFSDRFVDVQVNLDLKVGTDYAVIELDGPCEQLIMISSGRLKFGFDSNNNLRAIELVSLNRKEVETLLSFSQ